MFKALLGEAVSDFSVPAVIRSPADPPGSALQHHFAA